MTISPTEVSFDGHDFTVGLSDGRKITVPLFWYPRLFDATAAQREAYELSAMGLHWEEIDEDISVEGLLAGRMDNTRFGRERRAEIEKNSGLAAE